MAPGIPCQGGGAHSLPPEFGHDRSPDFLAEPRSVAQQQQRLT